MQPPMSFFSNGRETAGRVTLKFAELMGRHLRSLGMAKKIVRFRSGHGDMTL